MTLPYMKKQLDRAKLLQTPLFKLDLDYRHVKKAPLGKISRTGLVTMETAEAIMKLLDEDTASKSDDQLAALAAARKT
jgi:hypothetical protein